MNSSPVENDAEVLTEPPRLPVTIKSVLCSLGFVKILDISPSRTLQMLNGIEWFDVIKSTPSKIVLKCF